MRPRQRKVPQWAHKLRRARKKLPESVRIKSRDHCSEDPPSEVSVEVGASFLMDPLSTSKENVQDTEVQEFKVNEESEMPLLWAEDCWTSGSRYQTSEEGDKCYNEEDDTQTSIVIGNLNHLPDSGKAKSSGSKRRLLLDSPGTSGRTKRPCPQGSLGPTFYHHQTSSELAMLRQEVKKLHTRLDAMTDVMNALYRHTQNMQKILEVQAGWSQSEREICTQKAAIWDQQVIPPPDHSSFQSPTTPARVLRSLLPQPDPLEYLHSPPRLYPKEWLEQLGSHWQSTPVSSVILCYRSPATPDTHPLL